MWDVISSACRDLDIWPFNLISMSQAQVHTWPNFGEINSNIHEDIVFTRSSDHCLLWPWPLIIKANQLIYEPNIHPWPKLGVKFSFVGLWDTVFTRFLGHCLLRRLTFWPNQHVPSPGTYTVSQKPCIISRIILALSHFCAQKLYLKIGGNLTKFWQKQFCTVFETRCTSPNFGEINLNNYEDIVFTRFPGSLLVVILTFDLRSQKLISTTNRNTSVTNIGWNSFHWFVRFGVHEVFGWLPVVISTFDLLTPKAIISISVNLCDLNWAKHPSLVLRHGVYKVFGTHRLTHSRTHSGIRSLTDRQSLTHTAFRSVWQTWMQYASGTVFSTVATA